MTVDEINAAARSTPRLWTVKDLMTFAGISRTTIWRLMKSGQLSSTRIGKSIRFDPATARSELLGMDASCYPSIAQSD